jgi:hypothetical protein
MNTRKVLVVLELPEGQLRSCYLDDLGLTPQRGARLNVEGRLYEVTSTIDSIAVGPDGKPVTTDKLLLDLLTALSGGDQMTAVAAAAGMRHIGSQDDSGTTKSPGGLILSASSSLAATGDHLVYVQLQHAAYLSSAARARQLARVALEGADRLGATDAKPGGQDE